MKKDKKENKKENRKNNKNKKGINKLHALKNDIVGGEFSFDPFHDNFNIER